MKNLVIIPTYNECINSSLIYKKIRLLNKNIDILFIDDNSPDNTAEVIKQIQNIDNKIFLIERNEKKGIGSAHKEGFVWAKKNEYSHVITIDADLSHDPILIEEMLKFVESNDIIITGRFLNDNSLKDWSMIRKAMTHTRHFIIKRLFKIPFDTSGAFRCYNFKTVSISDLIAAKDNGYSFFWESLTILHQKNYKIHEIPITIPKRVYGSSKISIKDILDAVTYVIIFYIKNLKKK